MWTRISFLLVLLQCGSPQNLAEKLTPDATVTKYVPGAGGGVGVTFKVNFDEELSGAELLHFVVNGDTLDAAISQVNPMALEANKFYRYPEDSGGDPPADWKAPLYNATDYQADLYFQVGGEKHKIVITEITQTSGPLYQ